MKHVAESSGLAASRRFAGLYWTHSDSGGLPVLYAVDTAGATRGQPVRVTGAVNVDWEDIALDEHGNLWIADIGNNFNVRTDLGLWVVPEPDPAGGAPTAAAVHYAFSYPEQKLFPSPGLEFDAEALAVAGGKAYLFTKRRSDGLSVLYRLEPGPGRGPRPLARLGVFDARGLVTAADLSVDGRILVVLTYDAIWRFTARVAEGWLDGAVAWLPIRAGQCEAITIDRDGSLVLTNEAGSLFRVAAEDLYPVR